MYYTDLQPYYKCVYIVSFCNYDYYSSQVEPVIFGINFDIKKDTKQTGVIFNYRKEEYYNQILSLVFDIAWHENKIFFMPKWWQGKKNK